MGLLDFTRDAGESLRKAIGLGDKADADELAKALRDHGVTIEQGQISVKDDTVRITGWASNQAEKEKAVLILGNTKGVGHVDDDIQVRPAAQARPTAGQAAPAQTGSQGQQAPSRFYTVKSGDTLSKIAQDFYGTPSRYPEIFEANKPMLKDPDKIYPGQVLRIPQTGTA